MHQPASGTSFTIAGGGYRAEIASIGATLRTLRHEGRDLIAGFDVDEPRPAMRGALLVPWPNRLADGVYDFDGNRHELPIDEPETRTAVHGLVSEQEFAAASFAADRLVLAAEVEPRPGYPWRLAVEASFLVDERGLTQEIGVRNDSDRPAPVGIGAHPYLLAAPPADGAIDDWRLEIPADRVLLSSDDRMLPAGEIAIDDDARFDFRALRPIGATALNNAYTSLRRDADGRFRAGVLKDDGSGASIAWDARMPWAHVYTADVPEGGARRTAVAIEPMTCPPDAFNSGRDLLRVEPGATVTAGWTISAVAPGV